MNILAVCSANINRSPTIEQIFKLKLPQHNIKSAGIYGGYPNQFSQPLFDWANIIVCADISHQKFIEKNYSKEKPIITIGISDQYDRDQVELIEIIEYWLDNYGYNLFKKYEVLE